MVAFCPWVESHVAPFDMNGGRIMGFREAAAALSQNDQEAMWRACMPYYDHGR